MKYGDDMREFIFGTDWWTDCDDLAAMRILLRAHKRGDIRLLGVGINACMEYSVASVDGFINLEGVSDIPLGIDLKGTDFEGNHFKYQRTLSLSSCTYKKNEDAEDAVRLYRRLLNESDGNVEIIEVGFLQVFSSLLLSKGDDISPLDGQALVREKVKKVWVMAGKWDEEGGREHNFCNNRRSREAGKIFCELCPVPVTFLGFEAGVNIISGSTLKKDDFLYIAFCEHGSENGRSSWDPLTVYIALSGDEKKAGYTLIRGKAVLDSNEGRNYFTADENGLHGYVIPDFTEKYYEDRLNELLY